MEPFDLDILSTTGFSDLMWSLKRYDPERYKYSTQRSPEEIKQHVLDSRRVKHIIEEVRYCYCCALYVELNYLLIE